MQCEPTRLTFAAIALAVLVADCGPRRGRARDAAVAVAAGPDTCTLTQSQVPILFGAAEMLPLCDGVYAEPGLTPPQLEQLRRAREVARGSLARAFGGATRSSPWVLFCRTAECKIAFGASPAHAAANDLGFARDTVPTQGGLLQRSIVVVTGPVEGSARILTHELVHAEMKAWVPYDALPTWFNEGMATLLAGEPNCVGRPRPSGFDVTGLESRTAWEGYLRGGGDTLETYCQARQAVAAWSARFPDDAQRAAALRRLMTAVAGGMPFARARAL